MTSSDKMTVITGRTRPGGVPAGPKVPGCSGPFKNISAQSAWLNLSDLSRHIPRRTGLKYGRARWGEAPNAGRFSAGNVRRYLQAPYRPSISRRSPVLVGTLTHPWEASSDRGPSLGSSCPCSATNPRTSGRPERGAMVGHTTFAGDRSTQNAGSHQTPRSAAPAPLPTRATFGGRGRKPARSAPGGSRLSGSLEQTQKGQRAAPEQAQHHHLTQPLVGQQRRRQHTEEQ
jgi:hypothetical protein